ncbi:uncharacterized protein G2W53_042001 [Senna tora]|uniref:RNase H type-1 domain-containing protein n=1 Tax=Senna tora TaxID=362788 RepID=A0A834SI08_9FABA|nr:uncharacterized protein G2W53_042001 [Senna tora]
MARNLCILHVVVEGDSLMVMNKLNLKLTPRSLLGVLCLPASNRRVKPSVRFVWTPREANLVANRLAAMVAVPSILHRRRSNSKTNLPSSIAVDVDLAPKSADGRLLEASASVTVATSSSGAPGPLSITSNIASGQDVHYEIKQIAPNETHNKENQIIYVEGNRVNRLDGNRGDGEGLMVTAKGEDCDYEVFGFGIVKQRFDAELRNAGEM